ncbi:MAG: peptidoglycan DD-metalloendopeptidase family protein [Burkholderiaceae bacterium]
MTSHLALLRLHGRVTAALLLMLLAGCASRSLNAPPVVDWSEGAQSAAPAPVVVAPAAPMLYTVKRDDTLNAIGKRYNVTANDLAAWNNLGPNPRLKVDQVLRVSPPTPVPPPDSGGPVATTQPIGSETVEQRAIGTPPEAPVSMPLPAASNAPVKSGPLGLKRPYSDTALAELSRPDGDAPAPAVAASTPALPAAATASPSSSSLSWSWPAAGKPSVGFAEGKTKGLDIPGKAGDPVLAAADGKVTFSGTGVRGYGNFVIIRHSPELLSVYAHNRANLVKEGAIVTKGQKIAEMGSSDADAVKLHFEIRNDSKPVDPMKYLPER